MSRPEKDAMAQLLSDTGVKVSDLIDVSYLADNYAFNSKIIKPNDIDASYYTDRLDDALFSWEETDGTHYCLLWAIGE